MATMDRTVIDTGTVALGREQIQDETFTAGSAKTYVAGTILARRRVAAAITPSAVTGTGNGTVTAASVQAGDFVPKSGNWTLRCVVAATNGGTFRLEDPDGQIVVAGLVLTAGSGGANPFKAGGLAFTINDGSTDFAVGDTFTLPVTAVNKMEPFDPAGVGGVQLPIGVLTYDVLAAGAGDIPIRALINGLVNQNRLAIDSGASITVLHLDSLRRSGVVAVDVKQLAGLDN